MLVNPVEGTNAAAEQLFSWRWDGPPLRANERFDWRLLRSASGENVVDARTVTATGLTFSLGSLVGGDYYWSVRVIQVGSNGEFVALRSPEPARRLLRWSPPVQSPPTNAPRPTDTPVPPPTNTPRPTDTPWPTDTPAPPPTDTPAPPPTDTPVPVPTDTPPISWSVVPAANARDLQTSSAGGFAGLGLFVVVLSLSALRGRRR